jgi:hypothetical protein
MSGAKTDVIQEKLLDIFYALLRIRASHADTRPLPAALLRLVDAISDADVARRLRAAITSGKP